MSSQTKSTARDILNIHFNVPNEWYINYLFAVTFELSWIENGSGAPVWTWIPLTEIWLLITLAWPYNRQTLPYTDPRNCLRTKQCPSCSNYIMKQIHETITRIFTNECNISKFHTKDTLYVFIRTKSLNYKFCYNKQEYKHIMLKSGGGKKCLHHSTIECFHWSEYSIRLIYMSHQNCRWVGSNI